MITYAADNQKQNIIDCWKTAFPNDSEAFVNFYFEKKYKNENTLLYFKDDLAASLQMLPYKMSYYKHRINTAYISGAMTLPQYRNRGLMGNLLIHAFGEMRKRGDILTTLIPQEPWLIGFYKKFGYTPCFEYELTAINSNDYPKSPDKMQFKEYEHTDFENVYRFHKRYFSEQNLCIQKSQADFSIMIEECQTFEGNVYLLIDKAETVGLCFCFSSNGKIILKDCIAKDENYRYYFLSKLMQKFGNQPVFLYSPVAEASKSEVLGMARIIDAPKLMTLFAKAHPHLEFSVKIEDGSILENNITLSVSNGKVAVINSQTVDFELSIEKLTQLLLGFRISSLEGKYAIFPQQHPYMSLMLE
jgi:predicted acetyltransferase